MIYVVTLPFRVIAFIASWRIGRRFLTLVALAAVLAAGYWFWLRDSSLVAVHDVKVEGISTSDSAAIQAALSEAARSMTTLHVDVGTLERSVASYPTVKSVSASPSFPNGLTVHVVEQTPTTLLSAAGRTVAIAADGTVLTGLGTSGLELPRITTQSLPAGRRLSGSSLAEAIVLGATPPALRSQIAGASYDSQGVTVDLSNGIRLIFGGPGRASVKWAAASRVLADPSVQGLGYADLRVPERPAIGGGTGPATPPATGSTGATGPASTVPAPLTP